MSHTQAQVAPVLLNTSSPIVLAEAMRHSERKRRLMSWLLIAPLLVYSAVFFILPLCTMLYRAIDNPEVVQGAPLTVQELRGWQPENSKLPPNAAFNALSIDLTNAYGQSELGDLARRLNYEESGFRSLIMKSARTISNSDGIESDAKQALISIDERWGDPSYWLAFKRASSRFTPYYLLAAVDLHLRDDGTIGLADSDKRVYLDILVRTLSIAGVVTLLCLLIGYPLAALMIRAPKPIALILVLAIMLPFWTSLLARTTAWIVTLQANGLFNELLLTLGLINEPLELIFNSIGVYIVMVHILLPFAVLPIYNNLLSIPPHLMKASASLGGHPIRGFLRIYLPLSVPGLAAGGLLTFIVSAGYYITPSLVGSASEQMMGYYIAFYANTTVNWGMASALGFVLLICVMGLYALAATTLGVKQLAGIK